MGRRACRAGLLLWRLRLTPLPYRLRRGGGVAPAEMPVATSCACALTTSTYRRMGYYLGKLMGYYLGKIFDDNCVNMNGAPRIRTPSRRSGARSCHAPGGMAA